MSRLIELREHDGDLFRACGMAAKVTVDMVAFLEGWERANEARAI